MITTNNSKRRLLKASSGLGFTIVELLIVIVIIGVLAAIVVVAYNGITQQARTAKTLSAIDAWAKVIQLYRAETGNFPSTESCLGSPTTYVGSDGRCWGGSYWDVKTDFLDEVEPYIGSSYPEPDTTPISGNNRGAFYHESGGAHLIRVSLAGESDCPDSSIGSLTSGPNTATAGVWCEYRLD